MLTHRENQFIYINFPTDFPSDCSCRKNWWLLDFRKYIREMFYSKYQHMIL